MTANKMPEMPFSPYLVSEWTGPEMIDRKTWTAYTADQMRAMCLAGIEAANEKFDALVICARGVQHFLDAHPAYYGNGPLAQELRKYEAGLRTTLANLSALEQGVGR